MTTKFLAKKTKVKIQQHDFKQRNKINCNTCNSNFLIQTTLIKLLKMDLPLNFMRFLKRFKRKLNRELQFLSVFY